MVASNLVIATLASDLKVYQKASNLTQLELKSLMGLLTVNAITGLNGSEKFNILDAICFVLGLTDMSSMHAPHHPLCLVCAISIIVHFPSLTIPCLDNAEQIEMDIASARER